MKLAYTVKKQFLLGPTFVETRSLSPTLFDEVSNIFYFVGIKLTLSVCGLSFGAGKAESLRTISK
eukprot:2696046-Amphidinium_carterae.2